MVDYQSNKFKFATSRGNADFDEIDHSSMGGLSRGQRTDDASIFSDSSANYSAGGVHSDSIGEYKSEFIKVAFDESSIEVAENFEDFRVNKEIKKIDLNRLGLKPHVLREGQFLEQLYYGVRL